MPVKFWNFEFSYRNTRGKPVFVPSAKCLEIGYELKALVEATPKFDSFYYHLRRGGHVAALHAHRSQLYFARVDIERFFYSIGRNRVARVLHELDIPKAWWYAKWSTVKNPYDYPRYVLPYGFAQSPLLATLALARSSVGDYLRAISNEVIVSVYVDDIALSGNDAGELEARFRQLLDVLEGANFRVNSSKVTATAEALKLFNCKLEHLRTAVTDERKAAFYAATGRSGASEDAFERYCLMVETGNG
jgi:hypothetical protein